MSSTYGYNISCDPGDLYTRKCYVNVHSTPGCDPSTDPSCTVSQQEIIGYTSGGDPISKGPSDKSWLAWIPQLTTLNDQGIAYQPYGAAGMPYTPHGIAGYGQYEGGSGAQYDQNSSSVTAASMSSQTAVSGSRPIDTVAALGVASVLIMGLRWWENRGQ
jgi:hypothetical protein